jgi:hypothetical protein
LATGRERTSTFFLGHCFGIRHSPFVIRLTWKRSFRGLQLC